jgi:hypothetical protein
VDLLTRPKNLIASRINLFGLDAPATPARKYPIWYCGIVAMPYVAVNEVEQDASRRFGRDLFQTRSTP